MHNLYDLPSNLPVPTDDGQARHLFGATIADVRLSTTRGDSVSLLELTHKPTVLFFYPRTGVPGQLSNRGFAGEEWDQIPGARGCTPQNCAFRDAFVAITKLGVEVFGISTQTRDFQLEFKRRNHIPFDYLSDSELSLTTAMRVPTFEFPTESGGPNRLFKRMAWFVHRGRIENVWYPVFPPNENAQRVLEFLEKRSGSNVQPAE